ncbi:DUF3987 domain-containing protein [Ralstonia pseudosolanacearum]|uniref:DUF3987 domain-containing protein n=1 Tax=Ralstonia pseudosolanacearum TaxID=1310165 RepID=UPI003AAD65CE
MSDRIEDNGGNISSAPTEFPPPYEIEGDFPIKALPETIQGAVLEACHNEQVPGAVAAQAALAAISVACQDKILVRRAPGLESLCSLFLVTIMDTGGRKTQVDSLFTQGIAHFDLAMRATYDQEMAQHTVDFANWQDTVKGLRSAQTRLTAKLALLATKKEGDDDAETIENTLQATGRKLAALLANAPLKPRLRRRLYSQVSTRALEQCLHDNWPAAGLFSNEAADILLSKTAADMSRLDRLWDGQAIDVADVKEKDRIFVADPRLTLSLMIQPPIFDLFLKNKGEIAKGIGFMPRALIARPQPLYGKRIIEPSHQRRTVWLHRFNEKILRLLKSDAASLDSRAPSRVVLNFSPEAQQIWTDEYNKKERETADGGRYLYEREFVSRYAEHAARIAALFHYFEREGESGEIQPDSINRALDVCDWYLGQYAHAFNPEVSIARDAERLLQDIIRRLTMENGGTLPKTQTYSSMRMSLALLSRYAWLPLRKDKGRFELALEHLRRTRKIDYRNDYVGGSTKPTKMVELIVTPELFEKSRDSVVGSAVDPY